jgi:hypothetical protein
MLNPRLIFKLLQSESSFWLQWTVATVGGFLLSLLVVEVNERPDVSVIEAAMGGAIIGLVQSLVLSQRLSQWGWWVLVTLLGWGFVAGSGVGAIGWIAPRTSIWTIRLSYGAFLGATGGVWVGVGQWLILRKQVPVAWRWIVSNAFSWSFSLSIGWIVGGILRSQTRLFLSEVVGLAVTWLLVGGITGLSLIGLLRENPLRED